MLSYSRTQGLALRDAPRRAGRFLAGMLQLRTVKTARNGFVLIGVGLVAAACRTSSIQPDSPAASGPAPAVEASPVASAKPPAPAAPAPWMSAAAWTEAAAIDALAQNCALDVPAPPEDEGAESSPLACALRSEQSCVYEPCYFKETSCKDDCTKTCGTCEAACTTTCSSCKAPCAAGAAGDACRRACASSTGTCRQACLQRRDKCATADCGAAAKACGKSEAAKWKDSGCTGICPKFNKCTLACHEPGKGKPRAPAQAAACDDACAKRFPKCDVQYCSLGTPPEPGAAGN